MEPFLPQPTSFNLYQFLVDITEMFPPGHSDKDTSIRGTDGDASLARLSAARRGYLVDPFVNYFVSRPHLQTPRPPLINIGTYLRTTALDQLVNQWIELSSKDGRKCQIVSLGAGSDTRFWRLSVRLCSITPPSFSKST